jgi:acyl dehydratase
MDSETEVQPDSLTLEDLEVGQVFRSGSHTVDVQQIKSFASQFDPQPFHLDEERAKATFFGELVASGWHTAAITMRLLVASTPILGGLIGAGGELTWPRATKPGDTLDVETEVLEIKPSRSSPERGLVTLRSTTRNQERHSVQIMTCRVVVPSKTQSTNHASS